MPLQGEFAPTGKLIGEETMIMGYIFASPKGETSALEADDLGALVASGDSLDDFAGDVGRVEKAVKDTLHVVASGRFGVAVAGTPKAWKKLTDRDLRAYDVLLTTRA